MIDFLLYSLYKFFVFIVKLLPNSFLKPFLKGLAKLIYIVDKKHNKIAKANIDLVFKDTISDKRKNEIILNSYTNLVYNLYEFLNNAKLSPAQLQKKVSLENEEYFTKALNSGRGVILVSPHYGNWELGSSYISTNFTPLTMIGKPTKNKYFNSDIKKVREAHNSKLLEKRGSAKSLLKALRQGETLALVTDQHVAKKSGVVVDFLGYSATQVDSSARLASKVNALIVPIFFIQDDFGKYRIKFSEAIDHNDFEQGEEKYQKITQKEADIMSKQILEYPDIWFWQHKRFKAFHKEIYE